MIPWAVRTRERPYLDPPERWDVVGCADVVLGRDDVSRESRVQYVRTRADANTVVVVPRTLPTRASVGVARANNANAPSVGSTVEVVTIAQHELLEAEAASNDEECSNRTSSQHVDARARVERRNKRNSDKNRS